MTYGFIVLFQAIFRQNTCEPNTSKKYPDNNNQLKFSFNFVVFPFYNYVENFSKLVCWFYFRQWFFNQCKFSCKLLNKANSA